MSSPHVGAVGRLTGRAPTTAGMAMSSIAATKDRSKARQTRARSNIRLESEGCISQLYRPGLGAVKQNQPLSCTTRADFEPVPKDLVGCCAVPVSGLTEE